MTHVGLESWWGCNDITALVGAAAQQIPAPWPSVDRAGIRSTVDQRLVDETLATPVELIELDPRTLWGSRPSLLRDHLDYYCTGQWERTGRTSADEDEEVNRFPVVIPDRQGRLVIIEGHHRAAAALLEARTLRARTPSPTGAFHVTALLKVDPDGPSLSDDSASRLSAGRQVAVPDLDAAREVLGRSGASGQEAAGAVSMAADRVHSSLPSIAALYVSTIVTIREDGDWKPAGETARVASGPVHVITAWNPGERRPTLDQNRAATEHLRCALVDLGADPVAALGQDPGSEHHEASWAVAGLDNATARAIGERFGQVAVFLITRTTQTVLACSEPWHTSRATW